MNKNKELPWDLQLRVQLHVSWSLGPAFYLKNIEMDEMFRIRGILYARIPIMLENKLKFVEVPNISEIMLKKVGRQIITVERPKKTQILNYVKNYISQVNVWSESSLLASAYENFGKIYTIRYMLNPLYSLLDDLYSEKRITLNFIEERYRKFISILKYLLLVKQENGEIVVTETLEKIFENAEKGNQKPPIVAFGYVFSKAYKQIISLTGIHAIKRYVRVPAVYYYRIWAFQFHKPTEVTLEALSEMFYEQYGQKISVRSLKDSVNILDDANILKRIDRVVKGTPEIFKKFKSIGKILSPSIFSLNVGI